MTAKLTLLAGQKAPVAYRTRYRFRPVRKRWSSVAVALLNSEHLKRSFDISFSLFVLVACSPLYLLISLLIKLTSAGPIFYVQERVGRDYKTFRCLKFRTMYVDADRILEQLFITSPQLRTEFQKNFKLKRDPRVTLIGKFLRVTSLDEFPQFLNVLRGDMSVVGPRPLVQEELPRYGRAMDSIIAVRPGITGLWQVSGRNDLPYDRRIQLELIYSRYRSFILDLWIMAKTIGVMLFPHNNGAY